MFCGSYKAYKPSLFSHAAIKKYVGFSDFTSMRPGKERLLPSKGVTPIRGFKPTTASLGLESPRGNTESFYKATTYE